MKARTVAEYESDVRRPGKFEGSERYTPYYFDMVCEGWGSDECSSDHLFWTMFDISEEDHSLFSELTVGECVVVFEDDYGFVSASNCTKSGWEHFKEEMEVVDDDDRSNGTNRR